MYFDNKLDIISLWSLIMLIVFSFLQTKEADEPSEGNLLKT